MIKRAKLPVSYLPVTTAGGNQVSVRGSERFVPKEKLIGSLEYLFQQNLLKVSSQLPQSDLLREELRQFERRSQRGGALMLGAGTGHDDMALALAGWWASENKSRALSGPEGFGLLVIRPREQIRRTRSLSFAAGGRGELFQAVAGWRWCAVFHARIWGS